MQFWNELAGLSHSFSGVLGVLAALITCVANLIGRAVVVNVPGGIADYNGNAMVDEVRWSFATGG